MYFYLPGSYDVESGYCNTRNNTVEFRMTSQIVILMGTCMRVMSVRHRKHSYSRTSRDEGKVS